MLAGRVGRVRRAGEIFKKSLGRDIVGVSQNVRECREQCFQILNKLVDNGWRDQAAFDQDPDLDSVRADKRYRALLGRVKP